MPLEEQEEAVAPRLVIAETRATMGGGLPPRPPWEEEERCHCTRSFAGPRIHADSGDEEEERKRVEGETLELGLYIGNVDRLFGPGLGLTVFGGRHL